MTTKHTKKTQENVGKKKVIKPNSKAPFCRIPVLLSKKKHWHGKKSFWCVKIKPDNKFFIRHPAAKTRRNSPRKHTSQDIIEHSLHLANVLRESST